MIGSPLEIAPFDPSEPCSLEILEEWKLWVTTTPQDQVIDRMIWVLLEEKQKIEDETGSKMEGELLEIVQNWKWFFYLWEERVSQKTHCQRMSILMVQPCVCNVHTSLGSMDISYRDNNGGHRIHILSPNTDDNGLPKFVVQGNASRIAASLSGYENKDPRHNMPRLKFWFEGGRILDMLLVEMMGWSTEKIESTVRAWSRERGVPLVTSEEEFLDRVLQDENK